MNRRMRRMKRRRRRGEGRRRRSSSSRQIVDMEGRRQEGIGHEERGEVGV